MGAGKKKKKKNRLQYQYCDRLIALLNMHDTKNLTTWTQKIQRVRLQYRQHCKIFPKKLTSGKKTDQHLHVIHDTFLSLCMCMYIHSVIWFEVQHMYSSSKQNS